MSTLNLLLSEIRYRTFNFALSVLAIVAAATLFVAGPMLIESFNDQTQRVIEAKQIELTQQLDEQEKELSDGLSAKRRELDGELNRLRVENSARRAEKKSELDALLKETADASAAKLNKLKEDTAKLLEEMDARTKRLMRDLGFNLMIVHQDTDMTEFYSEFKAADMPEDYVYRLGKSPELTKVRHLVATLQQKYKLDGRSILLVGILPAVVQAHLEQKPPMGYVIKPGTVLLGHEPGLGRKAGQVIKFGEREFTVAKILPEHGTKEDIMVAMHLSDAQKVLDKPKTINQIMALGCKCKIERLAEVREQLEKVLKDTRVTEHRTRAIARAEQRKLIAQQRAALIVGVETESKQLLVQTRSKNDAIVAQMEVDNRRLLEETDQRHGEILAQARVSNQQMIRGAEDANRQTLDEQQAGRDQVKANLATMVTVTTPLVVLICAVWVGLLAWSNVRERRPEIGVLRALGKGSTAIASLFLGKAVLLGLAGGIVGSLLGYGVGSILGASFTPGVLTFIVGTIVGAPLLAAMASYLPTLSAIQQDPAIVLRDQ